jgi:putative transposase
VKGRKRHLLVDTLGLVWGLVVHSAGIQDRDGAKLVCEPAKPECPRLERVYADGAYAGPLEEWVAMTLGWTLEVVKRPTGAQGFVVLPKRWIVERTLAWLSRFRRLSKDYEETSSSSEAWIRISMIRLMLRRLAAPT